MCVFDTYQLFDAYVVLASAHLKKIHTYLVVQMTCECKRTASLWVLSVCVLGLYGRVFKTF